MERAGGARVVAEVDERRGDVGDAPGRLDDLARGRPLHGDERRVVGLVLEFGLEAADAIGERAGDGIPVPGVGDHEEAVVGEAVDDHIVNDAAGLGEHQRVLRLADTHRRDRAGESVVEERRCTATRDEELGHVRDIEETRAGSHRVVLGEVGAVAHRHEPAAEVGEGGAERLVAVVQGSGTEFCHEFSRSRTGRRRKAPVNSPSVMGLRVSPVLSRNGFSPSADSRAITRRRGALSHVGFRCGAGAPYSTRFLASLGIAFQSRPARTVRVPERLAGRLAPSVLGDRTAEALPPG